MLELLQETVKLHNLPFTILLLVVVFYWVIAMIGLVDLDAGGLDADVDVDVDLDLDIDADLDSDIDLSEAASGLTANGLLRFVGLGDAPLILILSLFSLFLWATNCLTNHYFNPAGSIKLALLLLLPVVIVAAILARLSLKPFAPLMRYIRSDEPVAQIVGDVGVVVSASLNEEFGRIEVKFDGRPLLLNAVLSEGRDPLTKGDKILVVSQLDNTSTYVVRPLKDK